MNYRYYIQDGDKAYSLVSVKYLDDEKMFVPDDDTQEDADIEFSGMRVKVDENNDAYVEESLEILAKNFGLKCLMRLVEDGLCYRAERAQ